MAINFPDSPVSGDSFTANNKTWVFDGTVWNITSGTNSVADGAITTAKIAAGAVTAAKLGNDISLTPADGSITTAKVAANAVTQAKLASNLSAVTITTTANRDTDITSPFTGQLAILTDTRKIQLYDGTSWVNVSLAPPETPTSLSATALHSTAVSVAFTAGGANGSAITNYKYALSTDSGSTYGSFTAVDPADITSPITISGLTAGTTYYIKLKAVNDMGDSVASSAVSVTSLASPEASTSLAVVSATTTTVTISFTAGADNGYAISNYQYALSTDGGSTYGSFTALATPDATSPITVDGLSEGTNYYIKIKAVNSGGAGTESGGLAFSTQTTVDYLVLAGGGGSAGHEMYGCGGAGGLRCTVTATGGGGTLETAKTMTFGTAYVVTVGAGAGGAAKGSDSVFDNITSIGGGHGGHGRGATGGTGGCGGGGGDWGGAGGSGTANQGYGGGQGQADYPTWLSDNGAGGGTGGGGSSSTSPGSPTSSSITGTSVSYGPGAIRSTASPVANRGGGSPAGAGGSGVVILRWVTGSGTLTLGAGLTGVSGPDGIYTYYEITNGSGTVSFA